VYGEQGKLPLVETGSFASVSPYGVAKLASEYYLATYAHLYGLETVTLRYSNVYGPRQRADGEAGVVAIFGRRLLGGQPLTIYGDGQQTRDMVYVEDVAAATFAASEWRMPAATAPDARAFNIGTGIETPVNRIAELLGNAAGKVPELRYAPARAGELLRSALAIEKAGRELRWRPGMTLAEGLTRTLRLLTPRD
jgi:UDP-glucose 4-epimerase